MALCGRNHSVWLLLVILSSAVFISELAAGDPKLQRSINKRVHQLNDDRAQIRNDAADALVGLAGSTVREQEQFPGIAAATKQSNAPGCSRSADHNSQTC